MSILSRLFGSNTPHARREALARGVVVEEVTRELPVFTRSNRFDRLQLGHCVRYSIPRQPGRLPVRSSFWQREGTPTAPFPHGWILRSSGEAITDQLRSELAKVAAEWTEELLEFEADEQQVSAYWEEGGGTQTVSKVVGYLERLAKA